MDHLSVKTVLTHKLFPLFFNIGLGLLGIFLLYTSIQVMKIDQLWGYSPLAFFMGCWMVISVSLKFIFTRSKHFNYFILSTVSGILLYMGFPDASVTPLLFLGFVPLLYIVERVIEKGEKGWLAFRYSYSAFLVWNILTTFWVANTSFVPSIVAFTLNSLFMTIPFMFYYAFRKRFNLNLSLVAFAAFWISWEMIHLRWEISWPWLTLGNAFSSRSLWVQWYEYTGHLGGSVWVLAMNALIFSVIQKIRKGGQMKVTSLLYPMLLLVGPMFASFFIFFGYQEKGEEINVCVVQPNYEPHYEKFSIPDRVQLSEFIELVKESATDTTDYIVFPETSFKFINIDGVKEDNKMNSLYNMLDSFPRANLITGLVSYKLYADKEEGVDNLREIRPRNGMNYMQIQNSAVELDDRESEYGVHVKGKLVPGAEIFPYSKLLFFLEPIVKKAGGSTAGHARSKDPNVLSGGKANVGASICYESIYGYWMRKFVNNGADLFFVVTNDGWWDNTPGHRQHLAFSILRAIEFRRSIARSANTGVSCVIDQHGRVFHPQQYGTKSAFNATIQANDQLTIYARYGDIVGRIAWLLSLCFLAFIVRKTVADKRKKKGCLPSKVNHGNVVEVFHVHFRSHLSFPS